MAVSGVDRCSQRRDYDVLENDITVLELPAQYIKNNTRTRKGAKCIRSVEGPSHTQLASHPLTWAHVDGSTVRCLTVKETALIQGFPSKWILPMGSRNGIRGVGNAVVPCVAEAIMKAAIEAAEPAESDGTTGVG